MKLWAARSLDNSVLLCTEKMFFDKQFKEWGSYYGSFLRLPEECFPELTFEVSPQEVELTLCNYIDTVKIQDHNPKKQTCVMTNHGLVTDVVFK